MFTSPKNILPEKEHGFTLIELIVVIIIVGILAAVGMTQYTKTVEKGRTAEAYSVLGLGMRLQFSYYLENGVYGRHDSDLDTIGLSSVPACNGGSGCYTCSNTSYYFNYYCRLPEDGGPRCVAYRCTSGGKVPNASAGYAIAFYDNGPKSCIDGSCP